MATFDDDRYLINFDKFHELYFSFVKLGCSQKKAYEKAESRYIEFFGQRKYSDYRSFYNTVRSKLKIQ